MKEYFEKRSYQRMDLGSQARVRVSGSKQISEAIVVNLSSNGLLIQSDDGIDPGTQLAVEIMPGKAITPPLSAEASVVRSQQAETGGYNIACSIDRILAAEDSGAGRP